TTDFLNSLGGKPVVSPEVIKSTVQDYLKGSTKDPFIDKKLEEQHPEEVAAAGIVNVTAGTGEIKAEGGTPPLPPVFESPVASETGSSNRTENENQTKNEKIHNLAVELFNKYGIKVAQVGNAQVPLYPVFAQDTLISSYIVVSKEKGINEIK